MTLNEIYPATNITEQQRENVLKPFRGDVVLHDEIEWVVCTLSIMDGVTTRLMKPDNLHPAVPTIKDVVLWKDKDKIVTGIGGYNLTTYDYFLSSKFDLYGAYF